jgi:hypothetical protein
MKCKNQPAIYKLIIFQHTLGISMKLSRPGNVWGGRLKFIILGEFISSYILHTRAFGTYLLGGGIYLAKKIIRWWYFTCKKSENIICDGILHVNMFHYFKIPYFTCTFFTKFTYNEYIGPYFLSHVVLRFSPVNSPSHHLCPVCRIKGDGTTDDSGACTHILDKGI